MMSGRRLPVAPRPYREELLSSWLGRVACRYGLDARSLAGELADAPKVDVQPTFVDDVAPEPGRIKLLARVCGVDPARLRRLALGRRHPTRPLPWFLAQGPEWTPATARSPPVCFACFDGDRAVGRDDYVRADWMLAERCVCAAHRRVLRDRCPHCGHWLHFAFRMREGRARMVCWRCEREFCARGEEDGALVDALLVVQERIAAIVRGAPESRERLETALSTLWAPLDDPGAARPVLALWFGESAWRCPTEAQHAIGAVAPLGRLPIAWRIVTLIAAHVLFGLGRETLDAASGPAAILIQHAAPLRGRLKQARGLRQAAGGAQARPRTEYRRLAHDILAHPDWLAAAGLPEKIRRRVMSRLIDVALAAPPPRDEAFGSAPGKGKGQSNDEPRSRSTDEARKNDA
jgi:hypothetical protein